MDERPENKETQVRISRLVTTSLVLAILMFVLPFSLAFLSAFLPPGWAITGWPGLPATILMPIICGILAIGFGIAGLVAVERSGGRLAGRNQAILGIVLPVLAVGLLLPYIIRGHTIALRTTCGSNLNEIGKAMSMYANDYQDKLPCSGGKGTRWAGSIPDWIAKERNQALGLDPNGQGGRTTVGSSLYLLIRYAECKPQMFVCNEDNSTRPFKPERYLESKGKDLKDLWDFGPEPWRHNSYSYQIPFRGYDTTPRIEAGMAMAADRNPWLASPGRKPKDFGKFKPDFGFNNSWKGTAEEGKYGNSPSHKGKGQNVLFIDGHVDFETRSFAGIDNDNIYTRWDGEDKIRGIPPDMTTQPADKKDSLLVHDPPARSAP